MKERVLKDEEGFTMVEVLIGIVILSIALIALAGLMGTTIRSGDFARRATEASNLAREKLEDIEREAAANFDSVQDTVQASDPLAGTNPDAVESPVTGHPSYTRETYITDVDANTKDVAVRVTWNDTLGSGHRVIFRTTLAR